LSRPASIATDERRCWRRSPDAAQRNPGCALRARRRAAWPLGFDSYLIRYPEGSEISPHVDPVQAGRHYRLNIVLKAPRAGGEFICATPIFATKRIKLFRPDACEHSVTRVIGGSRYVLSIGWVVSGSSVRASAHSADPPA
jgi:hypothetical protein